jgi:hypothetical protein
MKALIGTSPSKNTDSNYSAVYFMTKVHKIENLVAFLFPEAHSSYPVFL